MSIIVYPCKPDREIHVKSSCDFLGIKKGSLGEVVQLTGLWSAHIKFDCKDDPVQLQYPMDSHFQEYHKETELLK